VRSVEASSRTDDDWIVNAPSTRWWPELRVRQLWVHRELVAFFALRDLQVRYKQAFFGAAWAIIQPMIGALGFTLLFHHLAGVDVPGSSYFAFALVGFGAWSYFTGTIGSGAGSLVRNANLLTKVSFPRIVAPASSWLPGLIDLAVSLVLAGVATLVAGGSLTPIELVAFLPFGVVLLVVSVAGPALFLSATVVKYRDAQALVSFGLQFLLFVTPVAYPPDLVPVRWRPLLYLNPVAGAIGALRTALVDAGSPSGWNLGLSCAVGLLLFIIGLVRFRRGEREFADII